MRNIKLAVQFIDGDGSIYNNEVKFSIEDNNIIVEDTSPNFKKTIPVSSVVKIEKTDKSVILFQSTTQGKGKEAHYTLRFNSTTAADEFEEEINRIQSENCTNGTSRAVSDTQHSGSTIKADQNETVAAVPFELNTVVLSVRRTKGWAISLAKPSVAIKLHIGRQGDIPAKICIINCLTHYYYEITFSENEKQRVIEIGCSSNLTKIEQDKEKISIISKGISYSLTFGSVQEAFEFKKFADKISTHSVAEVVNNRSNGKYPLPQTIPADIKFAWGFIATLTVIGILIGTFWDSASETMDPSEPRGDEPAPNPVDLILTMTSLGNAALGGAVGSCVGLFLTKPLHGGASGFLMVAAPGVGMQ